jgi:hypothetical protein
MASTQLPSKGPVRLGSVNLPPGRLISGHFEGIAGRLLNGPAWTFWWD